MKTKEVAQEAPRLHPPGELSVPASSLVQRGPGPFLLSRSVISAVGGTKNVRTPSEGTRHPVTVFWVELCHHF